jgi:hypothetical protein
MAQHGYKLQIDDVRGFRDEIAGDPGKNVAADKLDKQDAIIPFRQLIRDPQWRL